MNIFTNDIITTENGVVSFTQKYKELFNKTPYFIDCSTINGRMDAYRKCDVVRSVLGKSSSFIANLKIWALNDDGSENTSRLAKQELAKLNRPNPKEDRKIFFKKLDQQIKLHGVAYTRTVKSNGEEYYYVIPRQYLTIEWDLDVSANFDRIPKRYIVNDGVKSYDLKPEEVHVWHDVTMTNDGYTMYGASRLESLSEVISTYVVIWEVLTEMYGDRGALNIISMGINDPKIMSLPQTEKEKDSFYDKLKKKFGIRRNQDHNIVTQFDAKVNPISAKMADMMFAETIKDCKRSIANAYEIPPELLGIESSRFKTVPEARKEAYTQSAITSMEYYISEWLIMRGIVDLPFTIAPDYSHLDFYQDAQLQKAIAFGQMANSLAAIADKTIEGKPIITWEQAQIMLDLK
jgi:phage portal protein BeeE